MREWITGTWRRLRAADPFLLVARLTLLVVLVNARGSVPMLVVATTAAAVLTLRPALMRQPWPWLLLGGLLGVIQWLSWWTLENHVITTTYWVLALGLSRFGHDQARVRRLSARLLIGLVFAFAFGWKLYSSQYVSNEFFRYSLVWDDRFQTVAELSGTDMDALAEAQQELIRRTIAGDTEAEAIQIPEGELNAELASLFTLWGLITEGTVALAYLLPVRDDSYVRPISVFAFCATTYLVAPVVGFGLLLLVLAAAATSEPGIRAGATVGCGVLVVWGFVFSTLLV